LSVEEFSLLFLPLPLISSEYSILLTLPHCVRFTTLWPGAVGGLSIFFSTSFFGLTDGLGFAVAGFGIDSPESWTSLAY